jgi:hypothetical protein
VGDIGSSSQLRTNRQYARQLAMDKHDLGEKALVEFDPTKGRLNDDEKNDFNRAFGVPARCGRPR